jgi:hypothetical protein
MKKFVSSARIVAAMAALILLGSAVLISCKKDNDDNTGIPVSGLMAFNLAPDVSAAGFSLSGSTLPSGPLAYNSFTGAYLAIYPGSRSVESFSYNSGGSLAASTFNFEPSKYYSVFLVGTDSTFENVIVADELDSLSGSGKAFVRYINAISDASTPAVTISSNGSEVVNDNAAYKTVSAFTAVDPGSIAISVSNGSTIDADRTITLEQQKIYTILLTGKPDGTGDAAVQIKFIENGSIDGNEDRTGSSSARAIN